MSGCSGPRCVAPCPLIETFAWLVVIEVPLGKASVEPSTAFQVPAVRVSPENCAIVASRLMRSRFGLDGSRVAERAVDQDRRRAGACGFLDKAGVVDLRFAAVVVRDAGVRLDQRMIRRARRPGPSVPCYHCAARSCRFRFG